MQALPDCQPSPQGRDPGHDLQQEQSQHTAGDGLADAHRQGIVGEQGGELGGEAALIPRDHCADASWCESGTATEISMQIGH